MNFRRGLSPFLLQFCAEDGELCFQKTHKLIHNLAGGVAALSVESDGWSFYVFRERCLDVWRFSRRLLQSLPKFLLLRSFETRIPTVSQTPGPRSHRPSRIRRGWLVLTRTLNPRKSEPNNVSGVPRGEIKASGQPPRILSVEEQTKMREVCKVPSFQGPSFLPLSLILHHLARPVAKSWTSLPLT